MNHVQLDNEPRRRRLSFSKVEDLKKAIVLRNQNELIRAAEDQNEANEEKGQVEADPIPIHLIMDVGTKFYGVPPKEITLASLLEEHHN